MRRRTQPYLAEWPDATPFRRKGVELRLRRSLPADHPGMLARRQFGMRDRDDPDIFSAMVALGPEHGGSVGRPFQPAVREAEPTRLCSVNAGDEDPTVGQKADRPSVWRPRGRTAIPDRRLPTPKRDGVAIQVDDDRLGRAEFELVRTDRGSVRRPCRP